MAHARLIMRTRSEAYTLSSCRIDGPLAVTGTVLRSRLWHRKAENVLSEMKGRVEVARILFFGLPGEANELTQRLAAIGHCPTRCPFAARASIGLGHGGA